MGVHTFPKGICTKVNVIVRREFELTYYDFAVQHFNHYTTRTPTKSFLLILLFLTTAVSLPWPFCIVFKFSSSFFSWLIHTISSLESKPLCIVINFLVLWLICLSFSLIHSKKGPEYLTRETVQVFIPLMRFLLQSLVLRIFLVLLRYSFFTFSFISAWCCLLIIFPDICSFLFTSSVLILS